MARVPAKSKSSDPDASIRICALTGGEEMLKRDYLARLRAALEAAHGAVEVFTYDGKSAPLADVLDELRSFSLMQHYKLVIVDEADAFVSAHREALERYAESPVDNATLVLRSVKWNKGNLDKLIAKVGRVEKFDALSEREALSWLTARAQGEHRRKLDPRAAQLLIERLGTDLSTMDNELAKLSLLVPEGQAIGTEFVEQLVGRSSDEEAWAIQGALLEALAAAHPGEGAARQPLEKLHEIVDLSGEAEVFVAYVVADMVRKLYLGMQMKRQGMNDFAIGKELKIWPMDRQQLFAAALKRFSPPVASRLFDRIVEMDVRAKSGRGDALRNLECFCAALGDEVK